MGLSLAEANKVDAVTKEVARLMNAAAELRAPLKVDVGVGANWDEAH